MVKNHGSQNHLFTLCMNNHVDLGSNLNLQSKVYAPKQQSQSRNISSGQFDSNKPGTKKKNVRQKTEMFSSFAGPKQFDYNNYSVITTKPNQSFRSNDSGAGVSPIRPSSSKMKQKPSHMKTSSI